MVGNQIQVNTAVENSRLKKIRANGIIGQFFTSSQKSALRDLVNDTIFGVISKAVAWRDRLEHIKNFPTCLGENMFYSELRHEEAGPAYHTKFYSEEPGNHYTVDFTQFKSELLKGVSIPPDQGFELDVSEPVVLPISVTGASLRIEKNNYNADLTYNNKRFPLHNLIQDRFYYLPLRDVGKVRVDSAHKMIVGDPIALNQKKKHHCRLAMMIFIDNFGWDIIEHLDFDTDLPNLSKFFDKGTIFDRSYSGANWTLPGVATIVSGRYIKNHGMFHNWQAEKRLGQGYTTMAEYFQNDGYLTFQVCNNPRKNPAYGYTKGYDRTVFSKTMSLGESLDAMYDHLRAFPERDHFCWLTIFDAHHTLAGAPHVANQINGTLDAQDYIAKHKKSPMELTLDPGKTVRYIEELKRIDFQLGMLFDYIEKNYNDDEFLVSVIADHGPGFLTDNPAELSHEKSHVVHMMRGTDVPVGLRVPEVVHTADVLPVFLKHAGLPAPTEEIDGRIPEGLGGPAARDFAISEIIFPGEPYTASIKNDQYEFTFASGGKVGDDGKFTLGSAAYQLTDLRDWKTDISEQNPKLTEYFKSIIMDHIEPLRRDA